MGVFVPIWLVLRRREATNLGVFDPCPFALISPYSNGAVQIRLWVWSSLNKGIWWLLCLGSVPGAVWGESPIHPGHPDLISASPTQEPPPSPFWQLTRTMV